MTEPSVKIPAEALAAARRGNLIEAIKITRETTGIGLKEAKDAVEAHLGRAVRARPARDTSRDRAGDYVKRPIAFALAALLAGLIAYLLAR